MEYNKEEKERLIKQTIEDTERFINELDPTKLIDIEFYKSYGLWDEEVSKKYGDVVKKWEKIKEITKQDKNNLIHVISDE